MAKFEVLIGGPYTLEGKEHRYGHAALRVITPPSDTIYDYGRYGDTWGPFQSQGEGILNIWHDFKSYILVQNGLGRTTSAFSFSITQQQAEEIQSHFYSLVGDRTPILIRGAMERFRIESDYDALNSNCTTIILDSLESIFPGFQSAPKEFNRGQGLSWIEKQAAKLQGWPDHLFTPLDLESFLKSIYMPDYLKPWELSPPSITYYRSDLPVSIQPEIQQLNFEDIYRPWEDLQVSMLPEDQLPKPWEDLPVSRLPEDHQPIDNTPPWQDLPVSMLPEDQLPKPWEDLPVSRLPEDHQPIDNTPPWQDLPVSMLPEDQLPKPWEDLPVSRLPEDHQPIDNTPPWEPPPVSIMPPESPQSKWNKPGTG